MSEKRFVYIWRYSVDPAHRADFLQAYNPRGEWARLFRSDPSYVETRLLQDTEDEDRYVTIDLWKSKAGRDSFRQRYSSEYEELDARCEAFTTEEEFLGDYIEIVE